MNDILHHTTNVNTALLIAYLLASTTTAVVTIIQYIKGKYGNNQTK